MRFIFRSRIQLMLAPAAICATLSSPFVAKAQAPPEVPSKVSAVHQLTRPDLTNQLRASKNTTCGHALIALGEPTPFSVFALSERPVGVQNKVTPYCSPPTPEDTYSVEYRAFIPQDHISGPAPCTIGGPNFIYLGDQIQDHLAFPEEPGYRVAQNGAIFALEQSGSDQGWSVGETFQFSVGSPANGSWLSSSDLDPNRKDCLLYNDSSFGFAETTDTFTPNGSLGETQVLIGNIHNPLEPQVGSGIKWNVSVTVNQTAGATQGQVTVQGDVSCYPSHQLTVNGLVVAATTGTQNPGLGTLIYCLVAGQTVPLTGIANVTPY